MVEVTGFEPATFWSRRVPKPLQSSDCRKNGLDGIFFRLEKIHGVGDIGRTVGVAVR